MQENPDDQVVVIDPAGAVPLGQSPLSLEAIRARMNMPAFEWDEQGGEMVIEGNAYDGSGDVRLLDEGDRIMMRGNYAHNMTVNISLKHLLQMKGWENITLSGNQGFCQELAYEMVRRDVQVENADLVAHASERLKREGRKELLGVGLVYLFFIGAGLAIPAFLFSSVLGDLFALLQKNPAYAVGLLALFVILLRWASRWITGRA